MTEFDADDLPLLAHLMDRNPGLRDTATFVKQVTRADRFPLDTFDDLVAAMGGGEKTVRVSGRAMSIEELRPLVPAYYFPINSARDLIAKVTDLDARSTEVGGHRSRPPQGTDAIEIRWAREVAMPADTPPQPRLSAEKVQSMTSGSLSNAGLVRADTQEGRQ